MFRWSLCVSDLTHTFILCHKVRLPKPFHHLSFMFHNSKLLVKLHQVYICIFLLLFFRWKITLNKVWQNPSNVFCLFFLVWILKCAGGRWKIKILSNFFHCYFFHGKPLIPSGLSELNLKLIIPKKKHTKKPRRKPDTCSAFRLVAAREHHHPPGGWDDLRPTADTSPVIIQDR